jgi:hypothetical protein
VISAKTENYFENQSESKGIVFILPFKMVFKRDVEPVEAPRR